MLNKHLKNNQMKIEITPEKVAKLDTLFAQYVDVRFLEKITKTQKLTKSQQEIIAINLYALSAAAYERLYVYAKTTLRQVPHHYTELDECVESMFSTGAGTSYYSILDKHLCKMFNLPNNDSVTSLYSRIKDTAVERDQLFTAMSAARADLYDGAIMCGILEFITPYVTEIFRNFNHNNKYVERHDRMEVRYGYIVLANVVQRVNGDKVKEIAKPFNALLKKILKEIQ